MAKEMILTASEITEIRELSTGAETYKWLLDNAGKEGFLEGFTARHNGISSLVECKAHLNAIVKSIDTVLKKCVESIPEEERPSWAGFNKQAYTTTFTNPQAAVFKLIELENTPMGNFLQWVTPKQAAEAAGITEDRLRADLGEMVVDTPKARVLNIK